MQKPVVDKAQGRVYDEWKEVPVFNRLKLLTQSRETADEDVPRAMDRYPRHMPS